MFKQVQQYNNFSDVIQHCKRIIKQRSTDFKLTCSECGVSNAFYRPVSEKPFCDFCWNKYKSKEISNDRKNHSENYLQYCNVPDIYKSYDFSFYDNFKYLDELKNYANLTQLYDLLLRGKAGHGKTGISICIIKALIGRGCDPSKMFYITENDFKNKLIRLQDNRKDYDFFLNEIYNYQFMVYDEIGKFKLTDFTISVTNELLDNRLINDKRTLMITNLDSESMLIYGSPFLSRLNLFEKMHIQSKDYRKTS